tara:strand:- start:975 stop:1466 length:492 start_codon:yes stop_codon:yes gene_type:complete
MDINATLFIEMIIFIAFVMLTMKYVWPPINAALDERRMQIETGLQKAEEGEKKLIESEASANEIVASAKQKAAQIVDNADQQAKTMLENTKVEAMAEKERIIEAAQKDVDQYVASKTDEISNEMVNISALICEKLLSEKIDNKKDIQLLLKQLEKGSKEEYAS